MFQIFKNFTSRCQNQLSRRASRLCNTSASSITKKITLPVINNENLRASVLTSNTRNKADKHNNKDYKFYCLYGDKAYSYYAINALKLKYSDVTSENFMKIYNTLKSTNFLAEIAKVCELDK